MEAVVAEQIGEYRARWVSLGSGPQLRPRSVRPRLPEDGRGCCPLYDAAWMRASVARALPAERAAQRLGRAAGGQGQARLDDCQDAVAVFNRNRPHAWAGTGKPPCGSLPLRLAVCLGWAGPCGSLGGC